MSVATVCRDWSAFCDAPTQSCCQQSIPGLGKVVPLTKPLRLITCLTAIFRNNSSRLYRHLGAYNNTNLWSLLSPPHHSQSCFSLLQLGKNSSVEANKARTGCADKSQTHRSHLASLNKQQKVPGWGRPGFCTGSWKVFLFFGFFFWSSMRQHLAVWKKQQQSDYCL